MRQRLRPPRPDTLLLLARAWWHLARTSARLRVAQPGSLAPSRLPSDAASHRRTGPGADIRRITWAITRVSPAVPGAECLAQAVAARDWLARLGVQSVVRYGVRRDATRAIAAHAWLEHDGVVVLGQADTPYAPLTPAGAATGGAVDAGRASGE